MTEVEEKKALKLFKAVPKLNAGGWYEGLSQDAIDAATKAAKLNVQYLFDTRFGAKAYAKLRDSALSRFAGSGSFGDEAEYILSGLNLKGDEVVIDIPCGHGNFGESIAKALPKGLLVCVDLSTDMLKLARSRHEKAGLKNVLYVHASALDLPFIPGAFDAVSACGGLHLYPDVDLAIKEMARVTRRGGAVAGLTFSRPKILNRLKIAEKFVEDVVGVRAFDGEKLGAQFGTHGIHGWVWRSEAQFGYFHGRVDEPNEASLNSPLRER